MAQRQRPEITKFNIRSTLRGAGLGADKTAEIVRFVWKLDGKRKYAWAQFFEAFHETLQMHQQILNLQRQAAQAPAQSPLRNIALEMTANFNGTMMALSALLPPNCAEIKGQIENLFDSCPICLEVIGDEDVAILSCGGQHKVHGACQREWAQSGRSAGQSCSLCRGRVQGTTEGADMSPEIRAILNGVKQQIEGQLRNDGEGDGAETNSTVDDAGFRTLQRKAIITEGEDNWHVFSFTYNQRFMPQSFKPSEDRKWSKEHKGWAVKQSALSRFEEHLKQYKLKIPLPLVEEDDYHDPENKRKRVI